MLGTLRQHLSQNQLATLILALETTVGGLLTLGIITYNPLTLIPITLITAFAIVQTSAILVWFTHYWPLGRGPTHLIQALTRLAFYAYAFITIGTALPLIWLAPLALAAIATAALAWLTDFIWYEATIAP